MLNEREEQRTNHYRSHPESDLSGRAVQTCCSPFTRWFSPFNGFSFTSVPRSRYHRPCFAYSAREPHVLGLPPFALSRTSRLSALFASDPQLFFLSHLRYLCFHQFRKIDGGGRLSLTSHS